MAGGGAPQSLTDVLSLLERGQLGDPLEVLLEVRRVVAVQVQASQQAGFERGAAAQAGAARAAGGGDGAAADAAGEGAEGLDGGESDDDPDAPDGGDYSAMEDETPRQIASKLGISAERLVAVNRMTWSTLTTNSKLLKGTVLQLPLRRKKQQAPAVRTIPPVQFATSAAALRAAAARAVLGEFDARFSQIFVLEGGGAPPADAAAEEPEAEGLPVQPAGPPIAKLHIAQRFPRLQAARPFAMVARQLAAIANTEQAAALLDVPCDAARSRAAPNPLTLNDVKAAMELGLYTSPELAAQDVRAALLGAAHSFVEEKSEERQAAHALLAAFDAEMVAGKIKVRLCLAPPPPPLSTRIRRSQQRPIAPPHPVPLPCRP